MTRIPLRLRLAGLVLLGLVLTVLGVAPQLQARVLGDEYVVRVAPVDPIDPFRGAYVDLSYPDLVQGRGFDNENGQDGLPGNGDVFISLERKGEVWVGSDWSRTRPANGPYLACNDRDWRMRCGIESWFVPQDKARELEQKVSSKGALATLKIDSRGHAAIVDLD